jgi:putative endopeptidase
MTSRSDCNDRWGWQLATILIVFVTVNAAMAQKPDSAGASTQVPLLAPRLGSWGFDTTALDTLVKPGDDFNKFANGDWIQRTVIPKDRVSVGPFPDLRYLVDGPTRTILETARQSKASCDVSEGRVGCMYRAFMDEATIERQGATPLKKDLDRVRAIRTRDELAELMGKEHKSFHASVFDVDITEDVKHPTANAIYLNQGGLGMPDRDYYLLPQFAPQKAAYEAYATHLLQLAGWPRPRMQALAIVSFETKIAEVSWKHAEIRDQDKTYNPTTIEQLERDAPGFAWACLMRGADLEQVKNVIAISNSSLPRIAAIVASTPLETLKAWEAFRTVDSAAPYLSNPFVDAEFDFRSKTLAGQPELPSRGKRGVAVVNDALGSAIGEIYTSKYFSAETESQVKDMVANLRKALSASIASLTWMGVDTKVEAQRKLANLEVQVGHPEIWRDYSALDIRNADLYGDVVRSKAFDWMRRVHGLSQPWDKNAWRFWPQYATAYTENNQLIFTAAIAQPPFFDAKGDAAINYGALGAVIGHELTHSFDDQGRKQDAQGALRDWWTPEDALHFKDRADRLVAQYSAFEPFPGLHVRGDVTLGENIADLGGLTIALLAYHTSLKGKPAPVIDGYSGDQRVFLGWAQIWRAKYRDDALRQLVTTDLHSPAAERINGVVRNMDSWYGAYDVKRGMTLYLEPSQRVGIW